MSKLTLDAARAEFVDRICSASEPQRCEDDLVWRLRHPLMVHGPGDAVELEKDATQADLDAAAATIDRITAERDGYRRALEQIRDGYENQDVSHVSYRVGVHQIATAALATSSLSDAERNCG